MERFTRLDALACPLPLENVDTDQLIPARFMKRSRAEGYGQYLMHDLRFDGEGRERADFVLNDARYAGAQVLVASRNFGTGSSREAAVYALADYGIRCVAAPSFGDIFASNAVKNGLLPAVVAEDDGTALMAALHEQERPAVTVDLDTCRIRCGALDIGFVIDPVRRLQLLNGWDDIDLTERQRPAIEAYRERAALERPWTRPHVPITRAAPAGGP
jgi:3-isopropylmalate/(R)-2-methylmalate dehydratase small subunit